MTAVGEKAAGVRAIQEFNGLAEYLAARVARHVVRPTPTNRQVGAEIEREYPGEESYRYLVACYARHKWAFQPKWAVILDEGYEDFYLAAQHETAGWIRALRLESGAEVAPVLYLGKEIVKRRYRAEGRFDLCRADAETGGFNDASQICAACMERERCGG